MAVNDLAAMDAVSRVTTWMAYAVFFGSLLSNLLAVLEGWAEKWWPGSRFGFALAVSNDLISRFIALNWRDKIAQQPGDRRQTAILPTIQKEKP
jgi:hypothetical protein